jgi:hypothetical protein
MAKDPTTKSLRPNNPLRSDSESLANGQVASSPLERAPFILIYPLLVDSWGVARLATCCAYASEHMRTDIHGCRLLANAAAHALLLQISRRFTSTTNLAMIRCLIGSRLTSVLLIFLSGRP